MKLDDIADRPGAASVTGYGANGRYPRRSASFPASRQRPDYSPVIPSRSGRRSADSRTPQQRDALPVLCHAPVAHLGVAEVRFTYRNGCSTFARTDGFSAASSATTSSPHATRHRRPGARDALPGSLRRPTPSSQRHAAALPPRPSLALAAVVVGAVRQTRPGVHPDVRLHPEIPLLALLRLASQGPVRGAGSSSTTARR